MSLRKTVMIVLIVIILILSLYIVKKTINNNSIIDFDSSDILIEKSYINWSWGFQYHGEVICKDGKIYSFNINGQNNSSKDLKDLNKFILQNAELEKKKVSKSDLEKMYKYVSEIDSQYSEREDVSMDAGSSRILIYNYSNNDTIILVETGDSNTTNISKHSNDLIKLVNKYLK